MSYRCPMLCLLFLAALGSLPAAHADQVTMANGDRLSGTVVRKSGNQLILRSPYAGELHLRWASVATIVTEKPVTLLLDDGTSLKVRLTAPTPAGTAVEAPELAHIRYINPMPEESGIGHHLLGHATFALSQARGNSANDQVHGDGEVVLRAKTYRITVGGEANYGRDSGITSTSNWRANTRYDHFFKPKEFVYARGSLEEDRFKDIRLRSILGGGYGYQLYESDLTGLSLRGGLDYVRVKQVELGSQGYAALAWGVDFRHHLQLFPAEIFHTQEGMRGFGNNRDTILQTRTGLRLPVNERLSATAQLNVDWESRPAPGNQKTDKTLLLGLGYAFH